MKNTPLRAGLRLVRQYLQALARFWRSAVEPPPSIQDPEIRRRARLINGLLVIIAPAIVVAFILQLVLSPITDWGTSTSVRATMMGILVVALIYGFSRVTGLYRLTSYAAILVGLLVIIANAVASQAPHLEIVYLMLLPLVGIVLLSLRELLVVSLVNIAALFGFSSVMNDIPGDVFKDMVVFLVLTQTFIIFVAHQRNRVEGDRQELALERARSDLLSSLLSNLSHDFRTPLTIINTSAYLLGSEFEPDRRHERVDQITHQTLRLNDILEDILMLSRLDHSLNASLEILDVNRVLRVTVEKYQFKGRGQHPVPSLQLASDLPAVLGCFECLTRAFAELIENAAQSTPADGSITIHSRQIPGSVIVEICDTGSGIAQADMARIFDPFFRGDQTRSTETGGAGLGLSIARRIIELHDGGIAVESVPGKGSTFRVILPVK